MKKNDVLYICVENIFTTGILQSMVVKPAINLKRLYGLKVGFTSMYRKSEEGNKKINIPDSIDVISGRRSENGMSIVNLIMHFFFLVRVFICSRKYKILHCRSYMGTMIGLLCKILWKQKVIFDVRGYLIDEAVESGKISDISMKYKLLKRIEIYLFKKSDLIISVSERMSEDIKSRFNRDSLIIRNPSDLSVSGAVTLRENVDKIICYNGSLNNWHMPELFFETMKLVIEKDPEYLIKVITPDSIKAKELSRKFKIPEPKIIIKSCEALQVIKEIQNSSLGWCIIKTSFSKTVCWPVKFNEYLSAKIPVIVNEGIGDLEKLVDAYNLGIVISDEMPSQVIAEKIISYVNLQESFIVDKSLAKLISWETQIETLRDCYHDLQA